MNMDVNVVSLIANLEHFSFYLPADGIGGSPVKDPVSESCRTPLRSSLCGLRLYKHVQRGEGKILGRREAQERVKVHGKIQKIYRTKLISGKLKLKCCCFKMLPHNSRNG